MTGERIKHLRDFYYDELMNNVIPFWSENGLDWEYGGLMDYLDRKGVPLSTDKGGWVQGRVTWIFSNLYDQIDRDEKWLKAAENCYNFLDKKIRRADGRHYFEVTRDGKPLVMRRYVGSDRWAMIGYAKYGKITGNMEIIAKARATLKLIDDLQGTLPPKIDPKNRPMKKNPVIFINAYQIMRECDPEYEPEYTKRIDLVIEEIFKDFVKPQYKALLENVAPDGSFTEGPEGRCVNPGHTIEAIWFILDEIRQRRQSDELLKESLQLMDWTMERGWDDRYGGLFSFLDAEGRQPAQIEWDMKYWWPHNEMIIASLLAYYLTGDEKYERWFEMVHDYSWSHFADRKYGEWYGYLRRDGTVALDLKGNHWKGPFHLPRCLMITCQLLDQLLEKNRSNDEKNIV
jgi:N-acylglucosamine 2-epimerase